jgi:hypothetical protein
MGSNGALGTTSRTSSSMSSPAHHQHISETNYMSDDNLPDELPNAASDLIFGDEAVGGRRTATPEVGGGGQNGGQNAEAAVLAQLTKQDFLVSFLVDARGGSMKGCRHSGVKVNITILHHILSYAES